jgi:hypothetical protein
MVFMIILFILVCVCIYFGVAFLSLFNVLYGYNTSLIITDKI